MLATSLIIVCNKILQGTSLTLHTATIHTVYLSVLYRNPQVADVADVVRQRADALMLCGESAAGSYPSKALDVLRNVSTHVEEWCRYLSWNRLLGEDTAECHKSAISIMFTHCQPKSGNPISLSRLTYALLIKKFLVQ